MSDRVFLDTNILIYVYSQDEPQKQQAIACTQLGSISSCSDPFAAA